MNLIFFFAESNFLQNLFSDKVQNAKNNILFSQLFFLLQEIIIDLNNKLLNSQRNKNAVDDKYKIILSKLCDFLEEFKNNKEITFQRNKSVLIKYNILQSFMNNIFAKINFENIEIYKSNFINILSEFFLKFIKYNYKRSKIYDSFLYFLRQSFINLYNFETNKNKIIQDLYINSFYSTFIKNLFFGKDNQDDAGNIPDFDCFYFNGFDSQISLNIQSNKFEKTSLFFSFNLIPIKKRDKYPLFLIQNLEKKKDDILKIYLKKDEKENFFYLYEYHQKKESKLNYKIKSNTTYYLCICFNDDQLLIKIYDQNKDELSSQQIKKSNKLLSISSIFISFGHYKKKSEVFSGFIGPIMILSNPKQSKFVNDFTSSVLNLGRKYIKYIQICLNLEIIEADEIIFNVNDETEIIYKMDKIECLLYLTPKNFLFFNVQSGVGKRLLADDNFCIVQENYIIQNFNVSWVKYEKGIYEFIKNNGLDYICLIYEYIYQFSENFFNSGIIDENDIKKEMNDYLKYITIIFKETLIIIEKIYHEIKLENFFKNLKQIYMNFFSCLHIITKHSNIMDELINPIFNIMNYYHNYFNKLEKYNVKPNIDENAIYIFEKNLSFMNGFIDFLLNPEIYYNFESKDTLILLFNQLSKYFSYIFHNRLEDKSNQMIYIKLINFIDKLYEHYNSGEDIKIDNNIEDPENRKNIINNEADENNILNASLKALKSFFENNPSKIENINNLKNMFRSINENLSENEKSFFVFSKFINTCIYKNVELYFNDDKNDGQILALIKVANKLISSKVLIKNEHNKENLNKSQTFDELISGVTSILMRILLTKEKLYNNTKIIKEFIIRNVEITNNLIDNIFREIRMVLTKYILTQNIENTDKKINKNVPSEKLYSPEKVELTSNFYFEIFNIIKFILEEINDNDKNNINNENSILEVFEYITKITRVQIDEGNLIKNSDSSNNSEVNNENYINYIDIILILINFLKFYYSIFFKRLYSERFVNNFIDLCNICYNSGLIYSTILIEVEENSDIRKTTLEIILDICTYYIYSSSNKYLDDTSQSNTDKESIPVTQSSIYNFIKQLFPEEENKSKDAIKKYTIFYINDNFRYFTSLNNKEGKKKFRKDPIYNEFISEFNNLQNIDELFIKQKKFSLNFSTFFAIKCIGYKQILIELISKIADKNYKAKNILKIDDLLPSIIYTIRNNYSEQELLYSKAKNFFFPKNLNTPFNQYLDLKRQIEMYFKKNNYFTEIDDYILNHIINESDEKFFSLIYSGLCLNKKNELLEESKAKKSQKHHLSISFKRYDLDESNLSKTYSGTDSALDFLN